jgi:hypothetical protein
MSASILNDNFDEDTEEDEPLLKRSTEGAEADAGNGKENEHIL